MGGEVGCKTSGEAGGTCDATSQQSSANDGVLRFQPPLSQKVTDEWFRLGVGQSLRVALLFDKVFWNIEVEYFGHLIDFDAHLRDSQRGSTYYGDAPAVEFTNAANSTGRPVLLAEVNRVLADRLQSLSDAEVSSFLVDKALRVIFATVDVPVPQAAVVKRFGNDPFLKGALSYPKIGHVLSEPSGEANLGKAAQSPESWAPLWSGRLLFAGEHVSTWHRATLDGALFTGIEAAWGASCGAAGIDAVPRPSELVRTLAIFGGWFPPSAEGCIDRVTAARQNRRSMQAKGPCWQRFLDELEIRCRIQEQKSGNSNKRHCLDQGD